MQVTDKKKKSLTGKTMLFGVVIVVLVLGTTLQIIDFLSTPEYEWLQCNPDGGPIVNQDWQTCE